MSRSHVSPIPRAILDNIAVDDPAVRAMTPHDLAVALTREVRLCGLTWRVAQDPSQGGTTMLFAGHLTVRDPATGEERDTWRYRVSVAAARQAVQGHRGGKD